MLHVECSASGGVRGSYMPHEQSFVLTQHGCMQVSTKLKVGVMWDHNGTYMEGFGFQYRDHQITVEITQDDKIAGKSPVLSAQLPWGRAIRKSHPDNQEGLGACF